MNKRLGLGALGALLVASTASAAPVPPEQSMCIDDTARRAVAECPAGAKRAKARAGNIPVSRLDESKPKKKDAKDGPTGPSLQIDMSTRMGRERTRARAESLLKREITLLKRLVGNTSRDDRRRPEILLRLAETQFEMQQAQTAKVRSFDEGIYQACNVQQNKSQCKAQRNGQKNAEKDLDGTRKETIKTYATLVRDHSDFKRMDEVLFSLAFGLDELKQFDQARKVYFRLIKGYPKSRFIPHAYLSFAEYYFAESDMNAALQFYKKVIAYPPKRNSVYGYALYKMAWVQYNRERYRAALDAFVNVLEFARDNPQATDAKNLARQVRKELVLPYSRVGTPKKALNFFRRYAKNNAEAYEMLENLAELYYDTGQWSKAITVYHKLMADKPKSSKLCAWQAKITQAVISSKGKGDQVTELKRLVDVYRTVSKRKASPAVAECKTETATVLTWLSTAWHREAVGSPKKPGTNDKRTMKASGSLYRLLLKEFPDLDTMEFPSIDRRDWPTHYKISYFYAELLWKMEEWGQCGPAFDKVVEDNPNGEFTSDAAYAAVLCYNNLYKQQYTSRERQTSLSKRKGKKKPAKSKFAPRKYTAVENGMLKAFSRYLCYVDNADEVATIKYRRARIFYEANHFEEAAVLFKDIAFNHKDSDLAEYAANLYLDCLNIMGTQVPQPKQACIGELASSVEPMSAKYCGSAQLRDEHPDLCGTLGTLQCQVRRKQAEGYEKTKHFKEAAYTYVRIAKENKECGEIDEILYNAAINFEAARLLGRAIKVRGVLVRNYPKSPWAKRAVYLIGANYHALAYYEQAAKHYEDFARAYPGEDGRKCSAKDKKAGTCTNAPEALENAVFFRLGLNDEDSAKKDATLYARNYKRKRPRETSQVQFSLGSIYERRGQWDQVTKHYKRYLKDYRRTALPHHLVAANTTIGRAYWKMNKRRDAKRYFGDAMKAWRGGAPNKIDRLRGTSSEEKTKYVREALDAAAEAQFHLSEYAYEDFKKVPFPKYRGGRSKEKVAKWAKGSFAKWVKKKLAALKSAEGQYNKVANLNVVSGKVKMESAPWQIAAAARVGEMYRSFVDEFRDAPVPREIEKDPQLYDIYVGALDEQSEPLQKQAISRFEFCLKTATNVRWFNRWSRQCEQELNQLNPKKYPVAAELRGDPGYARSTVGTPRAVELEIAAPTLGGES